MVHLSRLNALVSFGTPSTTDPRWIATWADLSQHVQVAVYRRFVAITVGFFPITNRMVEARLQQGRQGQATQSDRCAEKAPF